ncbi:glycosyltransferase family 4 protein [Dechloromonas sp. HYN0024]|uniref:glycosyltransferase family 4 protein n=1 Tax=Dechloromonas sp. HYN0024 TaxID=2231055 RepID=UPI000E43DA19|nr:glycosyltransferase family 4 protein [Dechloromonas sp. HYN0024]AXS80117.1 glycosyltransferase family 1 protein [Dechloromonas sp. HYN0024]
MSALKVLLVHNAYQLRGGEDSVVEAELTLLRGHGHEVEVFQRHNDELKTVPRLQAAADTIWSLHSAKGLSELIGRFKPDVVHFHNTFPLISPAAYWAVRSAGLPVIQTLHNFRLHCPQASYLRNGRMCEDCLGHLPWRGVLRSCYRGSTSQSAVLVGMTAIHRALGSYRSKVTRYIALNDFCRRKFIEGGLPAERIAVKPNFVDFSPPPQGKREGFLFVGRLSFEKGVDAMVRAWALMDSGNLRVAGTGPEANLLDGQRNLTALGALSGDAVIGEMVRSLALVLPSICYDSFPRTLVEAFACALPVIATRLGPLADLVEDGVTGLLFEAGNADDLAQKLTWAQANPEAMASMGRNARARYEAEFSAEPNYRQLIAIYNDAINAVSKEEK